MTLSANNHKDPVQLGFRITSHSFAELVHTLFLYVFFYKNDFVASLFKWFPYLIKRLSSVLVIVSSYCVWGHGSDLFDSLSYFGTAKLDVWHLFLCITSNNDKLSVVEVGNVGLLQFGEINSIDLVIIILLTGHGIP